MSENFNGSADSEAKRRADRIKAIKASLSQNSMPAEERVPEILNAVPERKKTPDVTAPETKAPEMSADELIKAPQPDKARSSIDDDIAALIAKCSAGGSGKVSSGSSTAESILLELDNKTSGSTSVKPREVVSHAAEPREVVSHAAEPREVISHAAEPREVISHAAEPREVISHAAEPREVISHAAEPREVISHAAEPREVISHAADGSGTKVFDRIPESAAKTGAPEMSADGKPAKKKKKKRTFKQFMLGFLPQRGDSIPERIRKIVFLGAIAVIIVCGYIVADYYIDLWRSKRENDKNMNDYWSDMNEPTEPRPTQGPDERKVYTLLNGAKALLEQNSEVVGVIRIDGTKVDNPVLQADDNEKYINQKLSGRESRAGELFLDYRNHFDEVDEEGHLACENSDNLVIYGHDMNDDEMFGCLKYYVRNYDYYGEHPVIELNSNYEQYKYKIFSFFILDVDDDTETKFDCWNKLNFDSEAEYYDFVNEAKRRTLRTNKVDVKYGDPLLTLSTCNGLFGDRGRLIILARRVRDGEDPLEGTQENELNPNPKYPSLYYDIRSYEKYDPDAPFEPYGPGTPEPETEADTETENTEEAQEK